MMDKIDCMEAMGMPIIRWAGTRIWNAEDFLGMLRLRGWKQNVRKRDGRKRALALKLCERCGQTNNLNRHHEWDKIYFSVSRRDKVGVLCKRCHLKAHKLP